MRKGHEGPAGGSTLRLRLEPSPHFAFFRDFLRRSEFNEPSICRRAGVAGLNEFLSNDRSAVTPSGELDGLSALVRLFLVGEPLGAEALEPVFPAGALDAMKALGLLIQDPADCAPLAPLPSREKGKGVGRAARMFASVALYPVGKLFIVSDRWTTPKGEILVSEDFVFPALTANSSQFIATLPWDPCENFLELCSGTGVAALAAAGRADHAWAVDITERSTDMAEFNRLLNGLQNVTAIQGDLYECLGDLTFDRIVAHPPYMPVLNATQAFYDGGVDGELVTRRIVMGLPQRLRPGGRFYCLAQGSDRDGAPFEQRVRAWLGEKEGEFDVLVIVRATQATADAAMQYAVKSKGGGQAAKQMRKALGELGIQRMAYGWMIIQRREGARPVFTVRRSIGSHSGKNEIAWLLKWEGASAKPEFINFLAEARPVAVPSVELHTIHRMKEGDLLPEEFSLQLKYPFSVDLRVQPWMGFMLPQCDGNLTVRQLLEFCKQHNFVQADTPLAEFAKLVMVFIANGFLEVEGFELPKKARE